MEQVKKFAFGKDFGPGKSKKRLEIVDAKSGEQKGLQEQEALKVLSAADIEKAEDSGYAKGKAAGLEEGKKIFYDEGFVEGKRVAQEEIKNSIETETLKIVEKVRSSLGTHIQERELAHKELKDTSVDIAIAVLKKIFPLYEERYGFDELKHQVENVIAQLADEEAIKLEVSELLGETQCHQLEEMFAAEGLANKVELVQKKDLRASDIVLKWRGGCLDRKVSDIFSAVEKLAKSE